MSDSQAGSERSAGIVPDDHVSQILRKLSIYAFPGSPWQRLSGATPAPTGTTCLRLAARLSRNPPSMKGNVGPVANSTSKLTSLC